MSGKFDPETPHVCRFCGAKISYNQPAPNLGRFVPAWYGEVNGFYCKWDSRVTDSEQAMKQHAPKLPDTKDPAWVRAWLLGHPYPPRPTGFSNAVNYYWPTNTNPTGWSSLS